MADHVQDSTDSTKTEVSKKLSKNCCVAYGCTSYAAKDGSLSYHKFPLKDPNRLKKWENAVRRKNWKATKHSVLCSQHFSRTDYKRPPGMGSRPILKDNAVPSIFTAMLTYYQPKEKKPRRVINRVEAPQPASSEPSTSADAVADDLLDVTTSSGHIDDTRVYIGDDDDDISAIPTTSAGLEVERGRPKMDMYARLQYYKRRVNTLSKANKRLKKKSAVQLELLKQLHNKVSLKCSQLDAIDGALHELIENQAKNKDKKTGSRYSSKIRTFAFTIYYYSPKAYRYLRTIFRLPAPRTIKAWLETTSCEPGFQMNVLDSLSSKEDNVPKLFSLVIDAMAIRKALIPDHQHKLQGYIDYGNTYTPADMKQASEALVFLLVPLAGKGRFPIGYFFTDKANADVQMNLIKQALQLTHEKGLTVVNVTCDGCPTNTSTLEKLGAKLPSQPLFLHPSTKSKVYTTLDAAHMLKLCRNAFGTLRTFKSVDGVIRYEYIEKLVEHQQSVGLQLANKLKLNHLKWRNAKMKVSLAAQMLSNSVADALVYMMEADPSFSGALPTINFIRNIDMLFDIVNSHGRYGRGYKQALTTDNLEDRKHKLNELTAYLDTLTLMDGRPLGQSSRRTFITGFKTVALSMIAIAEDVLQRPSGIQYVLGYKLSQDHLETLFSKIRSRGGFNNNPNVIQFKAAMKSLMVKNEITQSPHANCLDLEEGCASRIVFRAKARGKPGEDNSIDIDTCTSASVDSVDYDYDRSPLMYMTSINHIVEYIAGFITRTLKLTCSECITAVTTHLQELRPSSLISIKDQGGLITPAKSVVDVCSLSESVFRESMHTDGLTVDTFRVVRCRILQRALDRRLHSRFSCAEHALSMLREIVSRFLTIRLKHEAQKAVGTDKTVRSKLSKLILFSNV